MSKAKKSKEKWKKKVAEISNNTSLAIIIEEERFEAINELGDFPMLGEYTRTTPSHHSEASRQSNMDRERNLVSVSTEAQEHHRRHEDLDMEVGPSEKVLTNITSTTSR